MAKSRNLSTPTSPGPLRLSTGFFPLLVSQIFTGIRVFVFLFQSSLRVIHSPSWVLARVRLFFNVLA